MNSVQFKQILSTFIDNPSDFVPSNKDITLQLRDDILQISLKQIGSELFVIENDQKLPAFAWLINRVARLPQLADRILDYTPTEKHFVPPTGSFLPDLENAPNEKQLETYDVTNCIHQAIEGRNALSSFILYLTSDAGEGKSTIINELARKQASDYKSKKTNWLLLPIPLGGRPFLRFDDITIGCLMNRYRFPVFYYDSFIELVKLGVIVPAFDGFEEMFMESSTGEAISALGQLINRLNSQGSIVIASRKAYFDYKNFASQAKLFDTIESDFASFARISIDRWGQEQFVTYAQKRNVQDPQKIYSVLSSDLGETHPIITRAVLIKQIFELFDSNTDFAELARKIHIGSSDGHFSNFVYAIVEREANTKWIDRSGDLAKPLLEVDGHYSLLGMLSEEMWLTNTDTLGIDVLDFTVDLFLSGTPTSATIARQIKERLTQHALLIKSTTLKPSFSFDHEEFKQHFLGYMLSQRILQLDSTGLYPILRTGLIAQQTVLSAIHFILKKNTEASKIITLLETLCKNESQISFVRENSGAILIKLIAATKESNLQLSNHSFPPDSLFSTVLNSISFSNCTFQSTTLNRTEIRDCAFSLCNFEQIELHNSSVINNVSFTDCNIKSVVLENEDDVLYDPLAINSVLSNRGFILQNGSIQTEIAFEIQEDDKLMLTNKVLRRFIKSTQLNEGVLRVKTGKMYNFFEKEVLPILLSNDIIIETDYVGGGSQRRFKLGKPMTRIENALTNSRGNFDIFINLLQ